MLSQNKRRKKSSTITKRIQTYDVSIREAHQEEIVCAPMAPRGVDVDFEGDNGTTTSGVSGCACHTRDGETYGKFYGGEVSNVSRGAVYILRR